MEYKYWEIWYLSCEGNRRYTIIRTPDTWDTYQTKHAFKLGGIGDDPAEFISIEEYHSVDKEWDYSYDLTD